LDKPVSKTKEVAMELKVKRVALLVDLVDDVDLVDPW
jgi:hypothetical protein